MKDYMILLTEYLLSSCTCEWSFYIPEDESKEIVNSNAHTHTHTQVCYLKILNMYLTAYLFFVAAYTVTNLTFEIKKDSIH